MPKTDVLIAGSGSAGIFAATWLAVFNIPFTILEKRAHGLEVGQADGLQCRTVEIFESFGVAEELLREAFHVYEVCFWGEDGHGGIKRTSRTVDTENGLSHQPHLILNQARVNNIMLQKMEDILKEKNGNGSIKYGWEVKSVEVDSSRKDDPDAYCCKVRAESDGKEEVWEAKYVLGCDGAHSTTRKALDYHMVGDSSDIIWGVMDIYPVTNFPDIRRKFTVHASAGSLLSIPREGGNLVRLYIQMPPGTQAKQVTLEELQDHARKIMSPYPLEYAGVYWWSAYSIGQRLADHFHKDHRVFLTGDACHTHSPKAGQGMNVSLQDGYNLGWKLGSVLNGLAPPAVLETYVTERSKTAADLIAFDRKFAEMFSRKETREGEFAEYFKKSGRYTAGFTAKYIDSEVTDEQGSQDVAKNVIVGMRFPSAQVIRVCDCCPLQLQGRLMSDGRWRIIVLGGDINDPKRRSEIEKLANQLETLTRRYTPPGKDADSMIEPMLVLSSKYLELEQESIPDYFAPVTGQWRQRDLHKTYTDDVHYNAGHGHAYEKYGVDPSVGAVIIVRPDQYVSKITTFDDIQGISEFFSKCLIEQQTVTNGH